MQPLSYAEESDLRTQLSAEAETGTLTDELPHKLVAMIDELRGMLQDQSNMISQMKETAESLRSDAITLAASASQLEGHISMILDSPSDEHVPYARKTLQFEVTRVREFSAKIAGDHGHARMKQVRIWVARSPS